MFFDCKYFNYTGPGSITVAPDALIDAPDAFLGDECRRVIARGAGGTGKMCRRVSFIEEMPASIGSVAVPESVAADSDAYALETGEHCKLYGATRRGLYYALMTLEQLIEEGSLGCAVIYDAPAAGCVYRGYRTFIPGREQTGLFKKTVDMLAYYKYNTLFIEVGGAMEYKKHPEINDAWVEYCSKIRNIPGAAHKIQCETYPWPKNSIHADNGAGDYLTQSELRELIGYARERGLEVIPEVPSLSHCDYMLNAHPQFREREGDAYPDTYCPSKPGVYDLLFDILDEVIEVFEPRWVHIGHDECYTLGICPDCSAKAPEDLYADDVKKIQAWLRSRHIGTMMWGDKPLHTAVTEDGRTIRHFAEKLPTDVVMLHWHWNFNVSDDLVFHERGFPMMFGNVRMTLLEEWKKRVGWGAMGAFVSNWGAESPEEMQRNIITPEIVFTARALWSDDYRDEVRDQILDETIAELYRYARRDMTGPLITVLHTTDFFIEYRYFFDGVFIESELYLLGDYVIRYEDRTQARIPVKYGTNISNRHLEWTAENIALLEVTCSTIPEKRRCEPHESVLQLTWGGKREPKYVNYELFYRYSFENPYPEKPIAEIVFEKAEGKDFNIEYEFVEY
ncbi:MAG: family 20 glycosylhydrolase [Eubacteriales bacterium]|nr:family 20 glycosylhydrolase [Eubacteriales bacterium]